MVFRKDNKADSFQRQISALRQQLGSEEEGEEESVDFAEDTPTGAYGFSEFASSLPAQPSPSMAVSTVPSSIASLPELSPVATVIAHDTTWKGEIESRGTVQINGIFTGGIKAKETIFVAEEANVDATLDADTVIVAGTIKGSVHCGSRFEVLPSGRVNGDVYAPALIVHEGATINGQFRMSNLETGTQSPPTPVIQRRTTTRSTS